MSGRNNPYDSGRPPQVSCSQNFGLAYSGRVHSLGMSTTLFDVPTLGNRTSSAASCSRGNRFILRFGYLGVGVGDRAQLVAAAIKDGVFESSVVVSAWQVRPIRCVIRQRYNFDDLSDRASGSWTSQAALHDITQRSDLYDGYCSRLIKKHAECITRCVRLSISGLVISVK
jgi:hypothetical protein